jgi:hypothetical protein
MSMTLSIRKFPGSGYAGAALLAAGFLAASATGCYHAPTPATSAPAPLIVDEAMQKRDWSQSEACYQNGGVKSTSLRTVFVTGPHNSRILTAGLETSAFVGNAAVMPFTLITTPFNTPVIYSGEQLGPTFNAMPAFPLVYSTATRINAQPLSGSPVTGQ